MQKENKSLYGIIKQLFYSVLMSRLNHWDGKSCQHRLTANVGSSIQIKIQVLKIKIFTNFHFHNSKAHFILLIKKRHSIFNSIWVFPEIQSRNLYDWVSDFENIKDFCKLIFRIDAHFILSIKNRISFLHFLANTHQKQYLGYSRNSISEFIWLSSRFWKY